MTYDEPETECTRETAKAILVASKVRKDTWVPKSAVDDDSEVYSKGDKGILIVKMWWAEKEGWI